jgi:hypothetical protein
VKLFYISFKYNQQEATLHNILYCCQCSTCFRRFLRPSSGAQNCTQSIWYMSSLLAATANQQDATLYNILYCCKWSICFRRFLRPSSGAQNCTHSIWYMSSLYSVASCWLYLKEYIDDARSHERQTYFMSNFNRQRQQLCLLTQLPYFSRFLRLRLRVTQYILLLERTGLLLLDLAIPTGSIAPSYALFFSVTIYFNMPVRLEN